MTQQSHSWVYIQTKIPLKKTQYIYLIFHVLQYIFKFSGHMLMDKANLLTHDTCQQKECLYIDVPCLPSPFSWMMEEFISQTHSYRVARFKNCFPTSHCFVPMYLLSITSLNNILSSPHQWLIWFSKWLKYMKNYNSKHKILPVFMLYFIVFCESFTHWSA